MLGVAAALLFGTPKIELSTSEFMAHYGYLRSLQESGAPISDRGIDRAVTELEALDARLPNSIKTRTGVVIDGKEKAHPLYWRTLDALVISAGSVQGFADVQTMLPTIGGQLSTRDTLATVEKAILESQSAFAKLWPSMQRELRERIASFQDIPGAKRNEAVDLILKVAGISTDGPVSIVVVPKIAGKEGMTVRTRSGPLVVIGMDKYKGSDFVEVVLHESTHVFDTRSMDSLFAKLRQALTDAKRPPFEIEQVPHVAMFLLAAEAVRRTIDPAHKDVGETFGAYSRGLDPLRAVVKPQLDRLIAGRVTIDEAVSAIVASLRAPGKCLQGSATQIASHASDFSTSSRSTGESRIVCHRSSSSDSSRMIRS